MVRETYLLESIPKCLPSFRAAARSVNEEQVNVGLLPFLGRVHLLDGFDQTREKTLDRITLGVVEGLGGQEEFRTGNRARSDSLADD
jgi:hypothetical protein